MKKIIVSDVSITSYKCEMFFNGLPLACGTCFFYKFKERSFLVSNWHNFSGRDSYTRKPINKHGAIPNEIKVMVPKRNNLGFSRWRTFPLVNQDGENLWLEHPLGNKVDVAILEVNIPESLEPRYINELKTDPYLELQVAGDLFIVGYPLGLTVAETLPLWKRASFASEPNIDVNNLPKYLVDTATRKGMSGSPVFARGNYVSGSSQLTGNPFEDNRPWTIKHIYTFVGIYSGRLGDDDFLAQLGIVWKSRVVDEIIENAISKSTSYSAS